MAGGSRAPRRGRFEASDPPVLEVGRKKKNREKETRHLRLNRRTGTQKTWEMKKKMLKANESLVGRPRFTELGKRGGWSIRDEHNKTESLRSKIWGRRKHKPFATFKLGGGKKTPGRPDSCNKPKA